MRLVARLATVVGLAARIALPLGLLAAGACGATALPPMPRPAPHVVPARPACRATFDFCGRTWPVATTKLVCLRGDDAHMAVLKSDSVLARDEARYDDPARSALLRDLEPLRCAPALEELHIEAIGGTSDLTPLAGLTALRRLTLHHVWAYDLTPLGELGALEELRLPDANAHELGPLTRLTALRTLELTGNWHARDLGPLGALGSLRRLELDYGGKDLGPLARLTELEALELRTLSVLPTAAYEPLGLLANLTSLRLDWSGPALPPALAKLARLERVVLRNAELEDITGLAQWPRLRELRTPSSRVSDLTPLAGLADLETLELSHTRVTDLSPLRALARLRVLRLNGSALSDPDAAEPQRSPVLGPLSRLFALEELDIEHTLVRDLTPLSRAPKLRDLSASGSAVRDLAPLGSLVALEHLHIEETRVSKLTPLHKLTTLRTVWVDEPSRATLLGTLADAVGLNTYVPASEIEALKRALPNVGVVVMRRR